MTKGIISGIIGNLALVEVDGPVAQNEICYIQREEEKLMAEVIKIGGKYTYVQSFESTRGVRVGDQVTFTTHLLEAELGPGMLTKVYDGLQNDLHKLEDLFLQRGAASSALDEDKKWHFDPLAKVGDVVSAGEWLGEVEDNFIPLKIMVPFKWEGHYKIESIVASGEYGIRETLAVLSREGETYEVNMVQKWPVKVALKAYVEKVRPFNMLVTGVRAIDSLNPLMEGGTGFIPGPFGTGKTVLQHSISKQADADVVIYAACGERANEVVELFKTFPELEDPRTGRKLIERTIIVANTSNMPVAAREASVYLAMTMGEFYRAMGLKVLILADSTSRWAQAMREMSNRLEELPGPDAYPMDLSAVIANFYSRAGIVYLSNGKTGSITFLGTVSPAGGNMKEPVTEATKKSARCFYALSQARADSKRYPAIDPVESYSKYLEYPEAQRYLAERISNRWVDQVNRARDTLQRGREVKDQINILGDDGVPIEYHERFWKAEVIDFVILQQDAFDKIDGLTPLERQEYMVKKVLKVQKTHFQFEDFSEVAPYFKRMVNIFKQMNYSEFESDPFKQYESELDTLIEEKKLM